MPWHGCVRLLAVGTALAKLGSNAEPPETAPCTDAAVCWRDSSMPDVRTDDGYDIQMQVNHTSHFLLASLVMSALEAAAAKRGAARSGSAPEACPRC